MNFIQKLTSYFIDRVMKPHQYITDRYQIDQVLGMGSYGITYLVYDHYLKEHCVLKQLKKSKQRTNKGIISFKKEIEILSILNHPQIPKLRDSWASDQFYIVMDFINGKTFEDLIFKEGQRFNEDESFDVLEQVIKVVYYIHANHIVHRDLRIPNIMTSNGRISIIDFGLARKIGEHEESENVNYFLEKQLRRNIDVKSDFYALGHFTLFLLYSSYTPFKKEERSWEEELSLSQNARSILRKMLQIDQPYKNIDELQGDLIKRS